MNMVVSAGIWGGGAPLAKWRCDRIKARDQRRASRLTHRRKVRVVGHRIIDVIVGSLADHQITGRARRGSHIRL